MGRRGGIGGDTDEDRLDMVPYRPFGVSTVAPSFCSVASPLSEGNVKGKMRPPPSKDARHEPDRGRPRMDDVAVAQVDVEAIDEGVPMLGVAVLPIDAALGLVEGDRRLSRLRKRFIGRSVDGELAETMYGETSRAV